jgi:hypothetical protein
MLSASLDPAAVERASKMSEISKYTVKPIKLESVKVFFENYETF